MGSDTMYSFDYPMDLMILWGLVLGGTVCLLYVLFVSPLLERRSSSSAPSSPFPNLTRCDSSMNHEPDNGFAFFRFVACAAPNCRLLTAVCCGNMCADHCLENHAHWLNHRLAPNLRFRTMTTMGHDRVRVDYDKAFPSHDTGTTGLSMHEIEQLRARLRPQPIVNGEPIGDITVEEGRQALPDKPTPVVSSALPMHYGGAPSQGYVPYQPKPPMYEKGVVSAAKDAMHVGDMEAVKKHPSYSTEVAVGEAWWGEVG